MDALEIIDKIEELLDKGKKVPFTSNIMISENEIYEMLDELRNVLPEEFRQARWIVKEREGMIEESKRQSERIVREAKERSEMLVNETEILKNASRKAENLLSIAEAKSRTIRLEAEDYADEKLAGLEAALHKILAAIERGREQFKTSMPGESREWKPNIYQIFYFIKYFIKFYLVALINFYDIFYNLYFCFITSLQHH